MADVFISYAREDRDRAEQLARVFTQHGWSVWWDRRIKIGKHFSRAIEAELDVARCVVVVWSCHAIDSEWVINEASEGARRQILVPVRIDDTRLPLEFRRLQTADLTGWYQDMESTELDDCIAAIGEHAPLTPVAAALDRRDDHEREVRDQQAAEQVAHKRELHNQEVAEQATREREIRDQEAAEQAIREREIRDQQAAEQATRAREVRERETMEQEARDPQRDEREARGLQTPEVPIPTELSQRPRPDRLLMTFFGCVGLLVTVIVVSIIFSMGSRKDEPTTNTATTETSLPETAQTSESTTNKITETVSTTTDLTVSQLARTTVDLETTIGTISLEFRPDVAPNHVRNFVDLARSGFYDGTKFHRIIPGFMIQGGDPNTKSSSPATWGTGGSGRTIKAEFNDLSHVRGTLSMARFSPDPDSASSQFFICDTPAASLDRQYTVFGKVRAGMDVVDKIAKAPRNENENDRPNDPVTIVKASVHVPQL